MRNRVTYIGATNEQIKYKNFTDPRPILEVGKEYEIESIDIHNWHTEVRLVGIDGKFNSVFFESFNNADFTCPVDKIYD